METNVKKIMKDGFRIALMDGSIWQPVNIGDITKTCLWYPTQRIEIIETGEGIYSLINHDTSGPDEIEVSKVI